MKKYSELVVLFKKVIYQDQEIEFIPIKTIEGIFSKKDNCFIDKDGTPYYHIIENPDSYGYCYRDSIINYKKDYNHLSLPLIRALILREIKKYTYTYNIDGETSAPIILFSNKTKEEETNILLDDEISNFYMEKCPEFYERYINKNEEQEELPEENKEELNIKKIYQKLTSHIIDQDEAIQKLLTIIWKQNLGVKTTNKNIIIDGPPGVGKSKICKMLTEILNIPTVTISTSGGKMKTADSIIIELLKKTNLDIEKAQKGILVIDKFEEFINYSSAEGKSELETLLEKDKITVSSTIGEFIFDTSNLMIIGLSNLEKENKGNKQMIGFNSENIENTKSNLLEKFSQPIKMNKLNYDSFIKILRSQNGLLNHNIEFLNNQGITVKAEEPVIKEIATLATKCTNGAKSLEEIIERTLSVAEFEIASNPNQYSELIITADTIQNNKAYTLVRKKESQK